MTGHASLRGRYTETQNTDKAAFGLFVAGGSTQGQMAMMPDGSPQAWMRNLEAWFAEHRNISVGIGCGNCNLIQFLTLHRGAVS